MSILTGRSQQERLWVIGGGLAAVVLLLIGWVFFISPQRSSTASVRSQVDTAQTQNAALETRIAGLQQQSTKMAVYKKQLAAANAALPTSSGVPTFLRSLQKLGNETHTNAVNVTVGAPTALTPPVTPTDTSTSTDTSTPSVTPTDTTGTTPAASTTGVYELPITAQVTGTNTALDNFLRQLQEVQPRAVLITQITEGSGSTSTTGAATGNSLQLTMQAFVDPSTAAAATPGVTASDAPTSAGTTTGG
ncbi:type II secretion system protein GspM [Jatrophihabitans endophyticus]|uniref:type II secretion system protein GspM n=1 Tax=Jatrophihabitans endophyticus TaxID=1206085 RepID=UPI0019F3493B|nr:type II secretion system protein GspM [Jatrophihabitans endophyticus]MBE7189356.1 type II secretion system protein M [Jatrophihabitans endophyticus]